MWLRNNAQLLGYGQCLWYCAERNNEDYCFEKYLEVLSYRLMKFAKLFGFFDTYGDVYKWSHIIYKLLLVFLFYLHKQNRFFLSMFTFNFPVRRFFIKEKPPNSTNLNLSFSDFLFQFLFGEPTVICLVESFFNFLPRALKSRMQTIQNNYLTLSQQFFNSPFIPQNVSFSFIFSQSVIDILRHFFLFP